ncbi:MAG: PAS domain S-box protein [Desulfotignum sp.]|nr:PAS domain S-box protein [Desulfotignum sp.]MCF8090215.1 PAS domain S-box protein [Desulfotignum sp.]MCF8135990.1 PAS domain S-box protein [Desulfotignum sp.]
MAEKPSYEALEKRVASLETIARQFDRMQGEYKQTLNLLESLLASIPTPLFYKDTQGRYMGCNPAFTEIMGVTDEQIRGKTVQDLWPSDQARIYHQKDLELMENSSRQVYEFEVTDKDSNTRPVIYYKNVFRDETGNVAGLVGGFTDISEIRHAHEELLQRQQFLEAVLFHAPDAIITLDVHHRVTGWNPGAVKIFGYTSEEAVGVQLDDLVARGEHQAEAGTKTQRVLSGKRVDAFTTVRYRKDGTPIHVVAAGSPILVGGMLKGVVAVYTDISKYKKMEQALWEAQKMNAIGTLASGIAHDFNNLLMGIQGRVSLIEMDQNPGNPHSEHIAAIEEYVKSAVNLTKQLLGFAQGGKYEVTPIDINELIKHSTAMFGRTSKGIRIQTKTWPKPLVVEADKRQIEQVLLNLYVNALHAMPGGGELRCETHAIKLDQKTDPSCPVRPGHYVMISISDTGTGMTKEVLKKVFDPFFTTRNRGRGTGLGLASAYGIVTNHGGMITADSRVGHGSTFTIYLPGSQKNVESEKPVEKTLAGGTETILLVDDEAMILDVGRDMLERMEYRVVTADSGESALSQLSKLNGEVDLVVLDLIMPGMSGAKVFDKIREWDPTIPVILSSGYSINGQATELLEQGCNGFIQKPYGIRELGEKIRCVLDEKNAS